MAWFDAGIDVSNAVALGYKYGMGPARSGAEVAEFAQAMKTAGATPVDVCLLAAWMGGAAEAEAATSIGEVLTSLVNPVVAVLTVATATKADQMTAAKACNVRDAGAARVAKSWAELHRLSPLLATVVGVKASAKAVARGEQLASNQPASVRAWVGEVKRATKGAYHGSKDVAADVVKSAAGAAKQLATDGAAAIAAAVAFALKAQADIQGAFWGTLFDSLPWYVWLLLIGAGVGAAAYFSAPIWRPMLAARAARAAGAAA